MGKIREVATSIDFTLITEDKKISVFKVILYLSFRAS